MSMNSAPSSNTTTSDRLTTLLSYGFLLLLIYLVFRIYEPFLPALGWAAILVIFFYPMHHWLTQRFQPARAAVFSTLAVTILLIVPAILLTTLFIREAVSISRGNTFCQRNVRPSAMIKVRPTTEVAINNP